MQDGKENSGRMNTGDRVRIVDIGHEDAFFSDRKKYIGRVGTLKSAPRKCTADDDFYSLNIEFDNGDEWCRFYAAAITPEIIHSKTIASVTVEEGIIK